MSNGVSESDNEKSNTATQSTSVMDTAAGETGKAQEGNQSSQSVQALAAEYLQIVATDDEDLDDVEAVEEELAYWETQVEEFEEGTGIHAMAAEERDKAQQTLEEHQERGTRETELRQLFLDRAQTEFAAMGEWMDETVMSTLTQIVIGNPQEQLKVDEYVVPRDADELEPKEIVSISKHVQAVVSDYVDQDDRIANIWEGMQTERRYPALETLATTEERLTPSDMATKMDADDNRVGSALRYVIREFDYHPFFRNSDGEYTLSFLGEYLWQEYASDIDIDDAEDDSTETKDETETDTNDQQASLDRLPSTE